MRTRFSSAFTLLELVVVMAIIAILASIVIGVTGHAQSAASRRRALVEVALLHGALENYRADTGNFPQNPATDLLNPKTDFNPRSPTYAAASLALYQELTGDQDGDGVPDASTTAYLKSFDPRLLLADRNPDTHRITRVHGFQDPWGFPYGYSTAHLAEEQKYQARLAAGDPNAQRPTGENNPGYNVPGPDLWSTAGNRPIPPPTSQTEKDQFTAKWVKDW